MTTVLSAGTMAPPPTIWEGQIVNNFVNISTNFYFCFDSKDHILNSAGTTLLKNHFDYIFVVRIFIKMTGGKKLFDLS